MENNLDTLILIRFKLEDGETLLPEEQELWNEWKKTARSARKPELTIKDIALMLQIEADYPSDDCTDDVMIGEDETIVLSGKTVKKIYRWSVAPLKLVTSLIVLAVFTAIYLLLQTKQVQAESKAKYGETREIKISDQVTIKINAGSTLFHPTELTGDSCVMELFGEAYFELGYTQTAIPIIVRSGNQRIMAQSGSFNISAYPDDPEMITTVMKDSVQISNGSKTETVLANHQAVSKAQKLKVINCSTVSNFKSWADNKFIFNSALLPEIIKPLERWYGIVIQFKNFKDEHSDIRYDLDVPKNKPVTDVLNILETSMRLSYQPRNKQFQTGDTIWITNYKQ